MTPGLTRRDAVRTSGLGAALLLPGCSGGGDATSEGDTADAGNPWCGRAIWLESLEPRFG